MALASRQFGALARKNLLTRWRDWQLNLANVAQAVLFVLLVWIVDRAVSFSNQQAPYLRAERDPGAVPVASIPPCGTNIFLTQVAAGWAPLAAAAGCSCCRLQPRSREQRAGRGVVVASRHDTAALQGSSCLTLLYSPGGNPLVERLVSDIRRSNDPPLSPEEVRGFDSPAEVRPELQPLNACCRWPAAPQPAAASRLCMSCGIPH
jgi:hypothetical protein